MVPGDDRSPRSTSSLLNELVKCAAAIPSNGRFSLRQESWFSQAAMTKKDMVTILFNAQDATQAACMGEATLYRDEHMDGLGDDDKERLDSSYTFHNSNRIPFAGCAAMPSKCHVDMPSTTLPCQSSCAFPDHSETPIMERRGDGIDFIFELVESAVCGDQQFGKKSNGASGKGMAFEDLAIYSMPKLQKESLSDDESASKSGRSLRTHRTTSTRSRPRSTTSDRSTSNKSRSHKQSHDEFMKSASERSRTSILSHSSKKKDKVAEEIAKKATAYIRENALEEARIDAERQMEEYRRKKCQSLKSSLKKPNMSKPQKSNAFQDLPRAKSPAARTADLTAASSVATRDANESSTTDDMKALCVLSIGSGSSISSFGEGPSWSHHTQRSLIDTKSRAAKKQVLTPPTVPEVDEGKEGFYKTMRTLINFVHSFSTNVYGEKAAAPVNKAICFIALAMLVFFWPEDREANRIKIPKKEIPKKSVAKRDSLLTLVTKG